MAVTTKKTKRPLNKCTSCGRTWYPRGSNVSSRCPSCGSSKTKIAGLGILGTIGSFVLIAILTGHPGKPAENKSSSIDTSPASTAFEMNASTGTSLPEASTNASTGDASRGYASSVRIQPQNPMNEVATSSQGEDVGMKEASPIQDASRTESQQGSQQPSTEEGSDVFKHH